MSQLSDIAVNDPFQDFTCPHDFQCCRRADFSKMTRFAEVQRVLCVSEHAADCAHAVRFADSVLCTCPVRTALLERFLEQRAECLESVC